MRATVSVTLDLRELAVPLPVARTAVAITELRSGELIEGHDFYRFLLRKR
jgi:TusA-related sulfurtransferase